MAFKVIGAKAPAASPKPASSTGVGNQSAFAFSEPKRSVAKPSAPPVARRPSSPAPAAPSRPASRPQPAQSPAQWHGRSEPPPPRGSSYAEFYDWAADGLIATKDDEALALDFYLGIRGEPDDPVCFRR